MCSAWKAGVGKVLTSVGASKAECLAEPTGPVSQEEASWVRMGVTQEHWMEDGAFEPSFSFRIDPGSHGV